MDKFRIPENYRKPLIICTAVFSALYMLSLFTAGMNFSMFFLNVALWVCICFGQNWARLSKLALSVIIISAYIASGCGILISYSESAELPGISVKDALVIAYDILRSIAEIMILCRIKLGREKHELRKKL